MPEQILKYPRTCHLEGSRLQPGDEDLDQVSLDALQGTYLVIEEKVDGANAGDHAEIKELPDFGIAVMMFWDPDNIQLEITAPL